MLIDSFAKKHAPHLFIHSKVIIGFFWTHSLAIVKIRSLKRHVIIVQQHFMNRKLLYPSHQTERWCRYIPRLTSHSRVHKMWLQWVELLSIFLSSRRRPLQSRGQQQHTIFQFNYIQRPREAYINVPSCARWQGANFNEFIICWLA